MNDARRDHHRPDPSAPIGGVPVRVAVVTPCFNRQTELDALLGDLRAVRREGVDLRVLVVDNASTPPLREPEADAALPLTFVRPGVNLGGAGGFNEGMRAALGDASWSPDFIWIMDSDIRVDPGALEALLDVLSERRDLVAVGSELRDVETGVTYEIGGMVCRLRGNLYPAKFGPTPPGTIVECDYLAACSMLVRAEAVRSTGLMPEIFIYNDDVEWTLALQATTGMKVAGVAGSIVFHPWRKFTSGLRYFAARNAFAPLHRMGLARGVLLRRGLHETGVAASLATMGLDGQAEAHVRGLEAAAAGRVTGHAPLLSPPTPVLRPIADLAAELRRLDPGGRDTFVHPAFAHPWNGFDDVRAQLAAAGFDPASFSTWHTPSVVALFARSGVRAVRCLLAGPPRRVAVAPLGWCTNWMLGGTLLIVTGSGFATVESRPWSAIARLAWFGLRGGLASLRVTCRRRVVLPLPPVDRR